MKKADERILRDLAREYLEICRNDAQNERRELWRKHNSLAHTRPLIYIRAFAWREMAESRCECEDAYLRGYEDFFRRSLFWDSLKDDSIFEPWVTVPASCVTHPDGIWGLPVGWIEPDDPHGAKRMVPSIVDPEDFGKMVSPHHIVDEEETNRRVEKIHEAIGDLIPVDVDRAPVYRMWNGDISTQIAQLRGLERLMTDMIESPSWLHEVLAFMRDGILQTHEEAERAGDWKLSAHQNQAMPYSKELDDPAPNGEAVNRKDLWYFCASQETTGVGPQMFDEFMFQYQIPIMERFGLTAYGCCEDLTLKIGLLKKLPNLRRIAVAPAADVGRCAERIGTDYVLSYRPSPTDMVGYRFDPERVRGILRRDLEEARGCHVDITLKDVETVEGDPNRVRRWVEITREVIDEV